MRNIEGNQSEAPAPVPVGVSPGAKKFHLYRLIVFLHEQVASLRAAAHGHTAAEVPRGGDHPLVMGAVKAASDIEGKQFDAPTPLPRGVSGSDKDEHLYRQIASLHEQLASLRAMAHLHTKIGVEH